MATNYAAPAVLGNIQTRSLIVGVLALIVAVVYAIATGNTGLLAQSYLVAYLFWIGITLGCLGLIMVQYLGGAGWGLLIRRILESAAYTLPLMFVAFIPLFLALSKLYEWMHPEQLPEAARKILEKKHFWLNQTGWGVRAVIYFAVWFLLIYFLRKWSHKLDETGDTSLIQKAQNLSGPGFVLYGLAVTFASVDWIMSLDAEWYSTIFGLLTIAGQGVASIAFIISVCVILAKREPFNHVYQPKLFHDLGKLQLAVVMVWAYFSFSQLLITWSGNLPEEIPWYLERFRGVWRYIGIGLILLHFALPFALLLSRDLKRNGRRLVMIAWLIIIMRFVDLLWVIVPEFQNRHGAAHDHAISGLWLYIVATIGLGGLWLGWFMNQLRKHPLLPVNDPQLPEALAAGGHH